MLFLLLRTPVRICNAWLFNICEGPADKYIIVTAVKRTKTLKLVPTDAYIHTEKEWRSSTWYNIIVS